MFDPPHPGEIVRKDFLQPAGLSVTDAAKGLGVTWKALSDTLNGHSGISTEIGLRLEKAGWLNAEHGLRMPLGYDLWQVRQRAVELKVTRFPEPAAG